jgi:hypothetical protein
VFDHRQLIADRQFYLCSNRPGKLLNLLDILPKFPLRALVGPFFLVTTQKITARKIYPNVAINQILRTNLESPFYYYQIQESSDFYYFKRISSGDQKPPYTLDFQFRIFCFAFWRDSPVDKKAACTIFKRQLPFFY